MIKKYIFLVVDRCAYILAHLTSHFHNQSGVLHISYNVHVARDTRDILNANGLKIDYMSVGKFNNQDSNFHIKLSRNPLIRIFQEVKAFKLIASYECIHTHFGLMPSRTGWEYKLLSKMGIKVVYHARGCISRNYVKNQKLQPDPMKNICFKCDYNRGPCSNPISNIRRENALKVASKVIATTPDLLDFLPEGAQHMPFFSPAIHDSEWKEFDFSEGVKIIHVTNHPGIEGTDEIVKVIEELKKEGLNIDFEFLQGVPHNIYLEKLKISHLNIGKMKMGYYANAQIESMAYGVPAVTYVRDEFMNDSIRNSALILCDLHTLKETLREYVLNTNLILEKRKKCKSTIMQLHNNEELSKRYNEIYKSVL